MASLISETVPKFTAEMLRSAAKHSEGCHVIPVRLRRAIKRFLREQEESHMKRSVLRLSQSFNDIKYVNLQLAATTSRQLVEDPLQSLKSSKGWGTESTYGGIGIKYSNEQTAAYVASRMPSIYSACYRVLSEVSRRLPGFSPKKVLDFGAGTGSVMWAVREVWPKSLERINLVEPSQSMQRAGQSLLKNLKHLPIIHSYDSLQYLMRNVKKDERNHDLVIASYVLGEIPSPQDRITIVRQLWNLTTDVLILMEPGTPQGSKIISQVRSHILWMENRKQRKLPKSLDESSKDLIDPKSGAFVVAPCPHDGRCPLDNTGKYCHFVQRLERTTTQRAYKRTKDTSLRGYEDEKFCYVAFRKGQRPRDAWPRDGMKFETLKELHAKRNPEDLEIDYDDQFMSPTDIVPFERKPKTYDSDSTDTDLITDNDDEDDVEEGEKETVRADLGTGWGRIVYSPMRRGKLVEMDVCRSINREGSEGSFERIRVTKSKNPALHQQAKRSMWGDLWPF